MECLLESPIEVKPQTVDNAVKATVILHNHLLWRDPSVKPTAQCAPPDGLYVCGEEYKSGETNLQTAGSLSWSFHTLRICYESIPNHGRKYP